MVSLKQGDKAPDFTGTDGHGNTVRLADYAGRKLALYFYPRDNTPGCTAEACSLRDSHDALAAAGYAVLGVSPDSVASHDKFSAKLNLPFPLVADTDRSIASAFGVWGEKTVCGKTSFGILRTTFLIDENGVISDVISKVRTKDHAAQILER
jgi:peroxiredoxin Q/BCP